MEVINHYLQVGIIVTDNLTLKKFCNCQLENIFTCDKVYEEEKMLENKNYVIAYKDTVGPINKFCSVLFNKNYHGPCIIYLKDTDITQENCQRLLTIFKESNK